MCVNPKIAYTFNEKREKPKWFVRDFDNIDFKVLTSSKVGRICLVPCMKCLECKTQYARNWALRIMKELEYSKSAYFITLTYDDFHYNSNSYYDFVEFIEKIRHYASYHYNIKNIKYFASFEYGQKTTRKHFHLILFNFPIPDLRDYHIIDNQVVRIKGNKTTQMSSRLISDLWSKGLITIDNVNFNNASYVARYCMKKLKDNKDYEKFGLLKPKLFMSKSIGKQWLLDHINEVYKTDELFYFKDDRVLKVAPPRYFDRLLEKYNPDLFEKVKNKRLIKQKILLKDLSNMDYIEQYIFFNNKNHINKFREKLLNRDKI